jgi:methylglyoxal synthase
MMAMKKIKVGGQKRVALIAHDHLKDDLVHWCGRHQDVLKSHFLCGTGTTARLISEATGLPVKAFRSGPLGGDQQIGALIAEGEIDALIFFVDPLTPMPHDVDVKALMRLAVVYDIPMALNVATAELLLAERERS